MDPNSVVARILKARYFPNTTFMEATCQPGMSFSWRSILGGKDILAQGMRYRVGNGSMISIWNDPWIPLPYNFKPFSLPMEGTEDWKVEDIIDPDKKEWNQQLIEELFTKTEAEIILKIPLSLRNNEDRLIWHHDKKGIFNVNSGYHVARVNHRHQLQTSSSRYAEMGTGNLWRKIWKARIPPKIRAFSWRLLKGIIPTKGALAKKLPLSDVFCVLCHNHVESDVHLFKKCNALDSFWNACHVRVLPRLHLASNLIDWISEVAFSYSSQQLDMLLTCLWAVWKERNNILWNDGCFNPLFMSSWTINHLDDYKKLHQLKCVNKARRMTHWESPPSGRLKINLEGVLRTKDVVGGAGVIVRDEYGQCVAAFTKQVPYATSTLHVIMVVCRFGMVMAIKHGWSDIVMESTCMQLVYALENDCEDWSELGQVIEDCKAFSKAFTSIKFRFICIEANGVATRLAHLVSFSALDELWLGEIPSIIEDVLFQDFCNRTRGSGFTSPSLYNQSHL